MQELTYDISSINEVMERMVALYLVDEQTAMQIAESVNFAKNMPNCKQTICVSLNLFLIFGPQL